MIYNPKTRELRTDRGVMLKTLNCPLHKNWSELTEVESVTPQRHCESCDKYVLDLTGWSDVEAALFLGQDSELCVYAPTDAPNIRFYNSDAFRQDDPCPYRRIATVHGEAAINEAVKDGFRPLVKQVRQQNRPSKMSVWQNEETGEISTFDYPYHKRSAPWTHIIKTFRFYESHIDHPIAAYLLPVDLAVGERVFLTDLIPEPVSLLDKWTKKNKNCYGWLDAAYAIWDGKDLKIEKAVTKFYEWDECYLG